MRPTRPGLAAALGAAGLVAAGRVLGLVELYACAAAIGLLVVLGASYTALLQPRVRATRSVKPARVHAPNPCTVELSLTNGTNRTTPVIRLMDPVSGTAGAELLLTPLRPREQTAVSYRLPTRTRGLLEVGPLEMEVGDPFGLSRWRTRLAGRVEVTVLPRIDVIAPLGQTTGPDPDGAGDRTSALGRHGEDFAALRPYVVGDDLRRVHWPTSARSGDLLIRQDDVPWQGRLTVVVDLRQPVHDRETLERAISAAASIARSQLRTEDHVRLISTDHFDSGFGTGPGHLDRLLEYLAVAERSRRGRLQDAVGLAERGGGGGALVVVTGRPTRTDLEVIDRAGGGLTARRVVAFCDEAVPSGRRVEVLAVGPAATFAETWDNRTAAGSRWRSKRSRRQVLT